MPKSPFITSAERAELHDNRDEMRLMLARLASRLADAGVHHAQEAGRHLKGWRLGRVQRSMGRSEAYEEAARLVLTISENL